MNILYEIFTRCTSDCTMCMCVCAPERAWCVRVRAYVCVCVYVSRRVIKLNNLITFCKRGYRPILVTSIS